MKFPLSWLKEYIDIQLPPLQIAKILTAAGIEVDKVEFQTQGFQGIVVGKVLGAEKHPNADKLCVATVSDGVESFQVVCGASNCRPGIKTAFAKIGATLSEEGKVFTIKKTKIRGIESFGMLCSEKELQVSGLDEGIVEFAESFAEGVDLAEIYGDPIFEVSLTPNLGHCSSLIGIARELAAATGTALHLPKSIIKEEGEPIGPLVDVSVLDKQRCPRYACRLVRGVTAGLSPDWMQKKLIDAGVRPINSIVDITNYVLLEMGQPLHAFDFNKLQSPRIIVRSASSEESFETLDNQKRTLANEDLLICDEGNLGVRPIALAGIMGGLSTEVDLSTKDVLIESAYFQPSSIRRTSKRLGLQTSASRRFERSADPNGVLQALDRAASLMVELTGGKLCSGVIDVKACDFPEARVSCRLSRVNQLLGTHLSAGEVENVFHRLGFAYQMDGKETFHVSIPTYRADIAIEVDLIEEIARIYGYDNIEKSIPKYQSSRLPHAPIYLFEKKVRSRLLAEGLQELLTCDLIGPMLLNIIQELSMPDEAMIKVLNPNSIEQSILRTSLLPGLLQVLKYNYDHQNQSLAGFEIGRIHFKEKEQYKEQSMGAIVMMGKPQLSHWSQKDEEVDFFDLKGILENLFVMLGIHPPTFKKNDLPTFHPGRQLAIYVGSLEIGVMGEVHPAIISRLDVPKKVLFAEFNLHDLYQVQRPLEAVSQLAVFPCSRRDWTITVNNEVAIQEFFDKIHAVSSPYLEEVALLSLFQSDKLGKEMKNVTFRFTYRDNEKTIDQATVDAEHARIISEVS